MDSRTLKNIIAKLRRKFDSESRTGFVDLKTFAQMCNGNGTPIFTERFWRDRCRDREWPGIQIMRKWYVRKDYAEEFCRILKSEAA